MTVSPTSLQPHFTTPATSTPQPARTDYRWVAKVVELVKPLFEKIANLAARLSDYVTESWRAFCTRVAKKEEMAGAQEMQPISIPKFEGCHVKAVREKGKDYPDRFPVPDALIPWSAEFPDYKPVEYTAKAVTTTGVTKGWADPENFHEVKRELISYQSEIRYDDVTGRPLNPGGRTGMTGRGLLGKWGPNHAADPFVTRINPNGVMEMVVILRGDGGGWALPGGMVDPGEDPISTAGRELLEEAGITLDFSNSRPLFKGMVDDRRNTDNAWMETQLVHLEVAGDQSAAPMNLKAGSDAIKAKWEPITQASVKELYASHLQLVQAGLASMDPATINACANRDEILAIINNK